MAEDREKGDEQQGEAGEPLLKGEAKTRGNGLQDASEEMVRFMEQGDEPGHVGRGDGG